MTEINKSFTLVWCLKSSLIVSMRLPLLQNKSKPHNKQTQPHQRAVCILLLPGETPIKPLCVLFKINANKRQPLSERNKFKLLHTDIYNKNILHVLIGTVPFRNKKHQMQRRRESLWQRRRRHKALWVNTKRGTMHERAVRGTRTNAVMIIYYPPAGALTTTFIDKTEPTKYNASTQHSRSVHTRFPKWER